MEKVSARINALEESQTIAMSQKSRELASQGIDVINLSVGEPDFFTPDFVKAAAKKAIDENYSFYTPVPGYKELQEAICGKLKRENNLDFTPDQIVVSGGAKHSLSNVLMCDKIHNVFFKIGTSTGYDLNFILSDHFSK